ncbi:Sporulation and spore germination [Anaerovirgula multivorans]|uniref:Sporulation and spore germination n=1 Tax=Anaerovirgula multivorans TaxID=312168 RepID=A0A239IBB3_9FIRM|nr:GerMN domain-containing protein [Anaerovirgula multivorans]SNS90343.1 Sporulation and spore germination [Anaerovirgula multivorans]
MSRSIRAILLLIMIFVAASGMPLYADSMNFDFNFEFATPFNSSKEDIVAIDTSITMLSPSHPRLEISITANEKILPLQFSQTNPIELSIYFEDSLINTLEMKDITIIHGEPTIIQMDLPQNLLDIPDGNYEIDIKLTVENLEAPIVSSKIPVTYHTDATYVEALKSVTRNETALTLYFPDNDINHLVPITRVIPYTRTPLRSTIDHLTQGPKEALGLPVGSPIPTVQGLSLNRGIANVYLPRDIGTYDQHATSARIAVESTVNSLSAINEVQGVQFYFDNQILNFSFHETIVDKPIYPSKNPEFYVGNITNTNRILLTPVPMSIESLTIDSIFNGLKYSNQQILFNYNLQPTVPEEVVLLDYTIEGAALELKLNEAFMNAYIDYPDRRKMMVDSILYTFTSLENIESIEFQVEGFASGLPDEIPLNQPLIPSPYINPES